MDRWRFLLIITLLCASSVATAQTSRTLAKSQHALAGPRWRRASIAQNPQSEDPVATLSNYYEAINSGQLRKAYTYWETPSQTFEQFSRGFADTKQVRVLIDPSPQIEGAAGSSYASIASIIVSTQKNGAERVFAGCYVMRMSNVRAAEDPEQKGWRIYRAKLAPVSGKFGPALTQNCK